MIKRSTLRAQIAAALREEILAGRLPVGRHFTVKEIAEQYGVSATPVREALVDLAAQGLLDVEQHRGFLVHEFTADDYRAMVEAHTFVLDGLFRGCEDGTDGACAAPGTDATGPADTAVGLGGSGEAEGEADGATVARGPVVALALDLEPAALASVRRRAAAAERAARAADLDVLIGYDLRYWRELGGIVGNPYLRDFLDRMRVQCWVFAVPGLRRVREGGLAERLWARHLELLDAVERRDARRARHLVAAYHRHALGLTEAPRSARGRAPGPASATDRSPHT